ncbi:MAG: hypothetical protein WCQ78_00450 [Actinomycetes bacterium]|jgi:hypothetical protein
MKIVFLLLVVLAASGYLLFRMVRNGASKKYDRHPTTPWSALNDGVDPTQ